LIKICGKFLGLLLIVCILLIFIAATSVLANPGLKVAGAILVADVSPGQIFTHKIKVSIGDDDPPTDITVQVGDFGQSLAGVYQLVEITDNNELSARRFISIDKESFHLEPGTSQEIKANIHIPSDVGSGGRYSIIKITTGTAEGGGVGMITSVNIPIALTVKDTALKHLGQITQFTIEPDEGQSFNIATTFQNTGNHHFRIKGEITISNSKGETVDTVLLPLTATSIMPDMSLLLKTTYKPDGKLTNGKYTMNSRVMLEDGTILDEKEDNFEVKQPSTSTSSPTSTTVSLTSMPPTSSSNSTALTASSTKPLQTLTVTTAISSTPTEINWLLFSGIAGGVIIVGLLIYLLLRRRAK